MREGRQYRSMDKSLQSQRYIEEECGQHFVSYLVVLREVFHAASELVALDGVVVRYLDEGKISHNYPDGPLQKLKHLIQLSALSKLSMLVETLFGLADSLRGAPMDVPTRMMTYEDANNFARHTIGKHFPTNEVWRILAYPDPSQLPLDRNERRVVRGVLEQSCSVVRLAFTRLGHFLLDNGVAYAKFRHGLSIIPGLEGPANWKSVMAIFDRKTAVIGRHKTVEENFLPDPISWFNVVSLVPHDPDCWNIYSQRLNDLRMLHNEIVQNQLTRTFNPDDIYLPKSVLFPPGEPGPLMKSYEKLLEEKIAPRMDDRDVSVKFELSFKTEEKLAWLDSGLRETGVATFARFEGV